MPKWSCKEEKLLRANKNTVMEHLLELLPGRTRDSIYNKRIRMGVRMSSRHLHEVRSSSSKKNMLLDESLSVESLDEEVWQVLIGGILGDGCITRQSSRRLYYYSEVHCGAQRAYLNWKRKQLAVFCPCKISDGQYTYNEQPAYRSCTFHTCSHPLFGTLRCDFYSIKNDKGQKTKIPAYVFSRLNLLGFLVWYLDDGNANTDCGVHLSIAAYLWKRKQLLALLESLNARFQLALYIRPGRRGPTVVIPAVSRDRLYPVWQELFDEYSIPACMRYKLPDYTNRKAYLKSIQVRVRRSDGREFPSIRAAARACGCSAANIGYAVRGQMKTAMGFEWERIDAI